MVHADELCLGNYVKWDKYNVALIINTVLDLNSVVISAMEYSPIKLTPEVLEQIVGMIYDEDDVSWYDKETGFRLYPKTSESLTYEGFYLKPLPYSTISDFHTLQNLFRIITKKPLLKKHPVWQKHHL